jgi:hypothetical protein
MLRLAQPPGCPIVIPGAAFGADLDRCHTEIPMDNRNPYTPFLTGVKAAALIVVIGFVAVAADHAFTGSAPQRSALIAPPAQVSSMPDEGFAHGDLPRPTEADREPVPPSF